MRTDAQSLLLLGAGALFFVYLVSRMWVGPSVPRDERFFAARKRVAEAKRRARDTRVPVAERALALRDAAATALEVLRRPALAASYARRAERLEPQSPEALGLLARALRAGDKYQALERMLWRWLSEESDSSPAYQRAFDELLALYDGPLGRPEIAEALRRLRSASPRSAG